MDDKDHKQIHKQKRYTKINQNIKRLGDRKIVIINIKENLLPIGKVLPCFLRRCISAIDFTTYASSVWALKQITDVVGKDLFL